MSECLDKADMFSLRSSQCLQGRGEQVPGTNVVGGTDSLWSKICDVIYQGHVTKIVAIHILSENSNKMVGLLPRFVLLNIKEFTSIS